MKDTGLTEKEWEQIRTVLRAVPAIEKAVLFGSRAMGLARGNSDVDIMLYGEELTMGDVAHARALLEETTLPYQFDLVLHDAGNKALHEHVRRYGTEIIGKLRFESVCIESLASTAKNALSGGPFGSNLVSSDYTSYGIPVIRGQNMGHKWVGGNFVFVSSEKANKLAPNKARPGDLVFTQRGTLGQVSIVPMAPYSEYIISQSQMKLTPDVNKVCVEYLYYVFCGKEQQEYIHNNAIQTGVPHINLSILKQMQVVLPPLLVQQKIACVLSILDDRIQLLHETNATLEAMAQALFKSWFVDFDPVHAKAEGRAPEGMDAEIATLFPDEFEESELGMVPKGWKYLPLSEAYEINPRRKLQRDLPAKYLDMSSVGVRGHSVANTIIRSVGSGTKFQNGDTLLARITPCLENGKTAFVDFLEDDEVGWGSTEFVVLRPKAPLPQYHGYLLARNPIFRSFAIQSMSGTSGRQRIQNDALASFQLVVPSNVVCKVFEKIITALQEKITANHAQIRTLSGLRDTLLPRLISGKLRLPEFAEAAAEEAMA